MVKNEWKSLFHNKLLLIVLVAIIAIPAIYAGFFLNSMWDPYGNIDKLPVAVVNNDESVEYDGKILQVGDEMVDELKKNDEMQFNFVDAQTAENGLRNGTYYMVITIPEEFSRNAATLMDEKPKKMELTYETNPGTNYIASKMSETALTKIKDSVQEEVIRTYTETVFDQIGVAGDGMQEAADGAGTLQEGIVAAADGNETLTENLNKLADSTVTFQEGAKTLSDGANAYVAGTSTLADGAAAYVKGAGQLADGAGQLKPLENGLGEAHQGIKNLYMAAAVDNYDGKGSPSLMTGTKALKNGTEQLYNQVEQIELSTSTLGLRQLAVRMQSAGDEMADGAGKMQNAGTTIDTASQYIGSGKDLIENAEQSLNESVKNANQELQNQVDAINGQINEANKAYDSVNSQIDSANGQIAERNNQFQTANNTLNSNVDKVIQAMDAAEQAAEEQGSSLDLSTQKNALNNLKQNSVAAVDTVGYVAKPQEIAKVSGADDIQVSADLGTSIQTIDGMLTDFSDNLESVADEITSEADTLQKGAVAVPAIPGNPIGELKVALGQLKAGAAAVDAGTQKLSAGLETLDYATTDFQKAGTGIAALNNGFAVLSSNDMKLIDGAAQLKAQGSNLTIGAGQLAEGAGQIQEGSAKLSSGSQTLGEGMAKLSDGSLELKEALADGAQEVKDSKAKDQNIEMFAAPITDKETKMTEVENNGHAMAPYMMSVGLWVGCLAFCLIYPLMQYKGKLKSGFAWWASKATVLYPVAILQGLLLILILHFAIGFTPAELGKTIAFSCLTAVTFTSIMYFFNITLGKVGSFLMLVFMVIQLAGSAGTYPVEISPAFVSKIHWYLPFTYTVNSFRSTIAGGESIRQACVVMTVLFVIFTILTVIAFQIKTKRRREGKPIFFDWLEERGLA